MIVWWSRDMKKNSIHISSNLCAEQKASNKELSLISFN